MIVLVGAMVSVFPGVEKLIAVPDVPVMAPALKMVVQLLRIGERVGCRLDDGSGEGIAELRPRLPAVHGQSAEAERLPAPVVRSTAVFTLSSAH